MNCLLYFGDWRYFADRGEGLMSPDPDYAEAGNISATQDSHFMSAGYLLVQKIIF